jgi:hypothetical protein
LSKLSTSQTHVSQFNFISSFSYYLLLVTFHISRFTHTHTHTHTHTQRERTNDITKRKKKKICLFVHLWIELLPSQYSRIRTGWGPSNETPNIWTTFGCGGNSLCFHYRHISSYHQHNNKNNNTISSSF